MSETITIPRKEFIEACRLMQLVVHDDELALEYRNPSLYQTINEWLAAWYWSKPWGKSQ